MSCNTPRRLQQLPTVVVGYHTTLYSKLRTNNYIQVSIMSFCYVSGSNGKCYTDPYGTEHTMLSHLQEKWYDRNSAQN